MKPKSDSTSTNCVQAFDINQFEKEHFEYIENERAEQRAWLVREQEIDPDLMAALFAFEDKSKSIREEEEDALWAQVQINSAKEKIRELREEIARHNAYINKCNCLIQNFKRISRTEKSKKRGRPVRSEYRERIVRKFTKQWVTSLMETLEIKSCGDKKGLANVIASTQERNWRRWLSGEVIPSYSTFDDLLDFRITSGKYAGKLLYEIPVTPSHHQILTLLQFI